MSERPLRFASNLHGSYVMLPAKLDILRGVGGMDLRFETQLNGLVTFSN